MLSPVPDHPQKACEAVPDSAAVGSFRQRPEPNKYWAIDSPAYRLELSRGLGNEPALQGLLRVYKDYYPDIILGSTSTSRKSFAPVSIRPSV